MSDYVYIWADESCLGVQFKDRDSPGGAAGLIEYWKDGGWVRRDFWISEPATTNNRMAIRSGIEGLSHLKRRSRVIFTSDSQYLVKGIREWIHGWVARGWKRKTGAVENADLWKRLAAAHNRHEVDWRWVRGHDGHPHNEYANHLATRSARQQDASDGLATSGFEAWLAQEREKRERYFDFHEWAEPTAEKFEPARPVPI